MARTVPVYTYQAADGRSLRFAADSDFWITDMSGDDGLDIETKTSQSYGQTGKTITNQSVGERSITVTGAILRDLDVNEALLKKLVRPLTAGRWCKTVGSTVWYLDVVPAQTPIVSGGANLLNFQFKLKRHSPTGAPRIRPGCCWAVWNLPGSRRLSRQRGTSRSAGTSTICTRILSTTATPRRPLRCICRRRPR